jgi:hypothetical protein
MGESNSQIKKRSMLWYLNRSASKAQRGQDKMEMVKPKPLKVKPIKCKCLNCVRLREGK